MNTQTTNKKKSLTKKQVRETTAGKSISAWVILRNDGKLVATVQAAYLDSGNCMVDVWGIGDLLHQGKAGGYGYDKFTSALSGAKIDGITLYDHSVGNYNTGQAQYADLSRLFERYSRSPLEEIKWRNEAEKIGATFANWKDGQYQSLYYISGLDRLKAMGYKVIQAI